MKFILKLVSIFSILIFCITANQAQAIKFADFTVSDPFITVGESFEVTVSVFDDGTLGDLTGFGFDIDPADNLNFISFNGYDIGPDFENWGFGNHVEGLYLGTGNSGTDVLLATLSFTAGPIAGNDFLEIDGPFDDTLFFTGLLYFNEHTFTDFNESIYGSLDIIVNQAATPIPEPATILLLAAGVVGLGAFGRKKFRKSKD